MKRLTTTILSLLSLFCAYSQDNLVPNGGFEEISGKLKVGAKVDVAEGWTSVTATAADIFAGEGKDPSLSAPDNNYGREKAMGGSNYAGILAYSPQGKEPRSYIRAEFTRPLEKGKKYCVRFFVSLSDLSKVASNNIGANISEKQFNMGNSNEPLLVEANVMHSKNKVIETMVYWEPICGVYTAQGGERFITIGNFYADKGTVVKKEKKAPQFKQPQINSAYYFVDDVSVTEYDNIEKCECEKEEFVDVPNVVYKRQENNLSEDQMLEEVASMKIQFDTLSAELKGPGLDQVKKLADYMKVKSTMTVVIVGHASDPEMDKVKKVPALATLSANRAKAVGDYLIKSGIVKTRFKTEGVKNSRPFIYGNSKEEQVQNCAVNIEILTE
ncbi:MAG: OmpA family protein [Bacteroidota bacterium]